MRDVGGGAGGGVGEGDVVSESGELASPPTTAVMFCKEARNEKGK